MNNVKSEAGDRRYLADFALLGVVVNNRLRMIMESLETFDNRLFVVIDASARLSSVQQSLLHRLIGYLRQHISSTHHASYCMYRTVCQYHCVSATTVNELRH